MPHFDFDVVHTPEVLLVRIYYRDARGVLEPYAEVKLSAGSDFPSLYDSFRREHKWPSVEDVERELVPRYKGIAVTEREQLPEAEREALASRDLAEFFKTWLVLRGRGQVLTHTSRE